MHSSAQCERRTAYTKFDYSLRRSRPILHDAFIGHARQCHDCTLWWLAAARLGRLVLSSQRGRSRWSSRTRVQFSSVHVRCERTFRRTQFVRRCAVLRFECARRPPRVVVTSSGRLCVAAELSHCSIAGEMWFIGASSEPATPVLSLSSLQSSLPYSARPVGSWSWQRWVRRQRLRGQGQAQGQCLSGSLGRVGLGLGLVLGVGSGFSVMNSELFDYANHTTATFFFVDSPQLER